MTSSLIALVTRLSDEAEAQWLDLLAFRTGRRDQADRRGAQALPAGG
jgi:hypothetical protein